MNEEETVGTLPEYDPDMPVEGSTEASSVESESFSEEHVNEEEISKSTSQGSMDQLSGTDSSGVIVSDIFAAPQLRSGNTFSPDSNSNIYELLINNETVKVLFPKDAPLEVFDDQLVNVGSSNVTGTVLVNGSIPNNTYIQRTYTLLPATNANSNNNRYQYNAIGYITTYSPGNYGSLTSTQSYGNATVVSSPAFGVSLGIDTIIISCLLLALVLIQIIGGIFRR